MTDPVHTDVLIAGGGPCGLMLANELGRRGIRCLLVDPKPGTAFNPQANATQARTMEHFRRLGFAGEIRAQGLPADHPTDIAYFTRYTGHELARLQLPTAAQAVTKIKTMDGSWSAAELPHRVSQKFVETTLRRQAEALPGIDVRYGWALESFEDGGSHVQARVQASAGGAALDVHAAYLVGADGPRSAVRSTLGIAWDGASGVKREFMGGKMFAVYLRAPDFYGVFPHARAWMYVSVNPQRRAFMASVDGQSEFAFHAAVHEGEDAEPGPRPTRSASSMKRWAGIWRSRCCRSAPGPPGILWWRRVSSAAASSSPATQRTCSRPPAAWATTRRWKTRSTWAGSWPR